jgi:mRNA (2'-O-methyladenosine-N6-)-methyltransferase
METPQSDEAINSIKDIRQQLEARIETQHKSHMDMLSSVQSIIPNLVSSLDLSLKVLSSFNHRPFAPTPSLPLPLPSFNPPKSSLQQLPQNPSSNSNNNHQNPKTSLATTNPESEKISPLTIVRSMVAVCLLGRVPFSPIDSSTVLRKLENDQTITPQDNAALQELGGDSGGPTLAVEIALRSMADDNGAVQLEEFVVSGKARIMVLNIDRTRLLRELPETAQHQQQNESSFGDVNTNQNQNQRQINTGSANVNGVMIGGPVLRPTSDMWMSQGDPHMSGLPPMFSGGGPRGAPRLMGMMAAHRGIGIPPMHRLPLGPNVSGSSVNAIPQKPKTYDDDVKDVEALLNKKTFKEMQKSKAGEELYHLLHRPTARETAVAEKVQIHCLL